VPDAAHPVAQRLVGRVLERAAAAGDFDDLGAEQLHLEDVEVLPPHVLAAHVHVAREPERRRGGRGRDAVLPRAGLGDHPPLAHAPGEQRLPDRVVDLVRAGVVEVFALEVNLRAAEVVGETFSEVQPAGPPDELAEVAVELAFEVRINLRARVLRFELPQRRDERLGHEHPAEAAEVSNCVGQWVRLRHDVHSIRRAFQTAARTTSPATKKRV
jgi:hypothetical protein